MAFIRLCIQEQKCCPACGGTQGIKFHKRGKMKYTGPWGRQARLATQKRFITSSADNRNLKTVVCEDCEKRFDVIGEQKNE